LRSRADIFYALATRLDKNSSIGEGPENRQKESHSEKEIEMQNKWLP